MADTKTYTEKEVVLRERRAFGVGAQWGWCALVGANYADEAIRRYPLPKVTRPRVVEAKFNSTFFRWRVMGDVLEWANVGKEDWSPFECSNSDDWRAVGPLYRSLCANPTETVDDA